MTNWRDSLDQFFEDTEEQEQSRKDTALSCFVRDVAVPAFDELGEQLSRHGREISVRETDSSVTAVVQHAGAEEISYRIHGRLFPNGVLPYAEVRFKERKGLKIIRVESMFRSGAPDYAIEDLTKEEVIRNFLSHYMRAVQGKLGSRGAERGAQDPGPDSTNAV